MPNPEALDKLLYDKSYKCPLCNEAFKNKAIRSGKNQLISIDMDLYPRYTLVNPLYYCIVVYSRKKDAQRCILFSFTKLDIS